jgi:hypothetical protein
MNDLIKCPICGFNPNLLMLHDNDKIITYVCCGHTAVGLDRWNQYASSMALAKATVEFAVNIPAMGYSSSKEFDIMQDAEDLVLEVFGVE